MQLTIVCAVDNEDLLEANLLKSKVVRKKQCPILLLKDPNPNDPDRVWNPVAALNEGKMAATTTHIAFIQQSIFLPDIWYDTTMQSLVRITQIDSNFGALGVAGVYHDRLVGHIKNGNRAWGTPVGLPRVVDTLDEMLIITRKDNVWFDESTPSGYYYGADLCITYRMRDLRNYAINAYCRNNSPEVKRLPDDVKAAQDYLRTKYNLVKPEFRVFPIRTTNETIDKTEKKEKKEKSK